jgi:hypothetical protein
MNFTKIETSKSEFRLIEWNLTAASNLRKSNNSRQRRHRQSSYSVSQVCSTCLACELRRSEQQQSSADLLTLSSWYMLKHPIRNCDSWISGTFAAAAAAAAGYALRSGADNGRPVAAAAAAARNFAARARADAAEVIGSGPKRTSGASTDARPNRGSCSAVGSTQLRPSAGLPLTAGRLHALGAVKTDSLMEVRSRSGWNLVDRFGTPVSHMPYSYAIFVGS